MLYTFSQAHYSETELQRYLTEITENDAVVLWQDGVLLAVKYECLLNAKDNVLCWNRMF